MFAVCKYPGVIIFPFGVTLSHLTLALRTMGAFQKVGGVFDSIILTSAIRAKE